MEKLLFSFKYFVSTIRNANIENPFFGGLKIVFSAIRNPQMRTVNVVIFLVFHFYLFATLNPHVGNIFTVKL